MKKVKPVQTLKFIDQTYSTLLDLLDLTNEHRRALNSRGLTEKEIVTYGYKSLPLRRQELCASLIKRLGGEEPRGVPGFWKNGSHWDLAGKTGFVIPIRNKDSLITGLKIRVDKPPRSSMKYILLSSNPKSDTKAFPLGTAARTSVHWPLGHPKKIVQVRITEGELKADVASGLTDVYTISLPGVKMWRMALDAIGELNGVKEVRLAFDSDKNEEKGGTAYGEEKVLAEDEEETFLVGKACAELFLLLKERVPRVMIEDWPPEAGKGIDDVLLNGAQDRIELLEGERALEWAEDMLHADLPRGWVYASSVLQFINTKTHQYFDTQQYNNWFRSEIKGNPSFKALSNPAFPKFNSLIYLPGQPQAIMHEGLKVFNTWRGNDKITEDCKTSCKTFQDHAAYMIPDERERNIFLDFLAWNVQKAGEKILWAMLLQSKEGVGKSYFGDILGMILGPHNVSKPSNDEIHEIYTGWAKSCSLVVIEELMARGRMDLMNRLKPIITQSSIRIREMHTKNYDQPNVFNVLIFTNYEDALITKEDDRRYCVIYSQAAAKGADYYSELWDWTRENIGAIYHLLRTRDLTTFNPQARAPHTSWKDQMNYASMNPLAQWVKEMIETEYWPFQSDIVSSVHLHAKCLPRSLQNVSIKAVGDALRTNGCKQYPCNEGQVEIANTGKRIRLWSVKRHEIWQSAETATWIAEYEKWSNSSEPGNPLWDSRPI